MRLEYTGTIVQFSLSTSAQSNAHTNNLRISLTLTVRVWTCVSMWVCGVEQDDRTDTEREWNEYRACLVCLCSLALACVLCTCAYVVYKPTNTHGTLYTFSLWPARIHCVHIRACMCAFYLFSFLLLFFASASALHLHLWSSVRLSITRTFT